MISVRTFSNYNKAPALNQLNTLISGLINKWPNRFDLLLVSEYFLITLRKISDKIINNDQKMLADKTESLNRLQNSGCTSISKKGSSFGQTIKNPYLAQYKAFQDRLRNPKMKSTSIIMRKKKNQQNLPNKQNLQLKSKLIEQEQCLLEAKKFINNQPDKFTLFPSKTIDYDVGDSSKQSEVMLKFRQKLHELKLIKNELKNETKSIISMMNFSRIPRYPKTQATSSAGSERRQQSYIQSKPQTAAQIMAYQRSRIGQRWYQSVRNSSSEIVQRKPNQPITFINYKRNKSFAERFTKQRK